MHLPASLRFCCSSRASSARADARPTYLPGCASRGDSGKRGRLGYGGGSAWSEQGFGDGGDVGGMARVSSRYRRFLHEHSVLRAHARGAPEAGTCMRDASRARPPRGKGGHCGDLSKEAKELGGGGGDVGCWKGRRKARMHCSAVLPGLARPRLSRFWLLVAVAGAARDGSGRQDCGFRINCFRSAAVEGGISLARLSTH